MPSRSLDGRPAAAPIAPTSAKEIALRGDVLLVLTRTATLDAYNVRTGALLHRWTVRSHASGLDAYGGVRIANSPSGQAGAAFWVHAVRLSTGRDVIVARGQGSRLLRSAAIEAPGLVYARDLHELVFMPLERVLAAVAAPRP